MTPDIAGSQINALLNIAGSKTNVLLNIIKSKYGSSFSRAIVVGCGTGHEAFALRQMFDCSVEGIDLDGSKFASAPQDRTRLVVMDAAHLEYPDEHFDLLYSFHAIEHLADLDSAMGEMRRVLRRNGVYCIGTPNKTRLVGYLGSPLSLREKIDLNLWDFSMRIRGRWENRFGAHAGFTREELLALCRKRLGHPTDQTDAYYRLLYFRHARKINAIISLSLADRVFPAIYVTGRRDAMDSF